MKILEFDARIMKAMKTLKFHMRITKLMKIIEFHMRNIENHLNLIIQRENHENHENHKSPCEIIEKHKK